MLSKSVMHFRLKCVFSENKEQPEKRLRMKRLNNKKEHHGAQVCQEYIRSYGRVSVRPNSFLPPGYNF